MTVRSDLKFYSELAHEMANERLSRKTNYYGRELDPEKDQDEIIKSRQLATQTFVKFGKISPESVNEEGLLKDDILLPMSTFFAVYNQDHEMQATNRLLWRNDATVDDLRLPVDEIAPEYREYLSSLRPGSVAEIASLSKAEGASTVATLKVLREIWRFAGKNHIETFVCGLEPKVLPKFQAMFGDAITPLADETTEFPGIKGEQQALMIDVAKAVPKQESSEHSSMVEKWRRSLIGNFIVTREINGTLVASDDQPI